MKFTKQELQNMVSELEKEFASLIKSEIKIQAQPLAKSELQDESIEEDEQEEKIAQKKAKEEAEEAIRDQFEDKEEDIKSKAEQDDEDREDKEEELEEKMEKEEQKEEEEGEEEKEKEEDKDEDEDDEESHGYDEEDLEELHKMYMSMSKAERKAHLDAIKKCGEIKLAKSEESSLNSKIADSIKAELEEVKKENGELKKSIEGLISALNTFVTKQAPARKAITNLEFVKKSEIGEQGERSLTKSEINAILVKKVTDPSLSARDRQAINEYYLNGASVEKIQHLLKQ